ncbi:uncharacterized protein LOC123713397 [Pieris brassicae]|uniref:SIAH-type domain-containing protein n=1 Tax=Pieris brassicae TaxID=7116 RepID=A0A9P0TLF1_PIEBR|nr:uncharacterized protein LOC123713397 [Pieris brassicae]XP_045522982.1 uncharacterized protein LOC123713397 [Pieris brassicae]CAH4033879.1 unnamed protein product [Pieris brassicae]
MGAENSRPKSSISNYELEVALERQRKVYESQTQALLQIQRDALVKSQEKQRTSEVTSSTWNTPGSSVTNSLYPNLPGPSNGNPFAPPDLPLNRNLFVQNVEPAYLDNSFQVQNQYLTPSAPPLPINTQETQSRTMQPHRPQTIGQRLNKFNFQRCPNYLHGCSLRFEKHQLTAHVEECPFNDLICPMNSLNGCSWKGKIHDIKVHFAEFHPQCTKIQINKEDTLHICGNYQFVNLITLDSYNFLFHLQVDQHNKKISFGVQLIGTKVSAAKWTYEVRVYNKKEPRRLFKYVDKCHSNCVPLQVITDQFATMSLDYAKTFSEQNIITFRIFLRKDIFPSEKKEQYKEKPPRRQ